MMPDAQALRTLWEELRSAGVGRGGHLISSIGNFKIFAGVSAALNPMLAIVTPLQPGEFKELRLLRISTVANSHASNWTTILELLDAGLEDEFSELCAVLISASNDQRDDVSATNAISSEYSKWLRLFTRKAGLSIEQARGLFAELTFLAGIGGKAYNWDQALDSWKGPSGYPQDFVFPDAFAVEVKSIQPSSETVVIASEAQLDFRGRLHLAVFRLEDFRNGGVGQTLNALVEEIQGELSPKQVFLFQNILETAGFDNQNELCSDRLFSVIETTAFDANGYGFPKITPQVVPPQISHVSYQLSLTDLIDFRI